ncbi:MAG TPA: phosphoribosylformylglycinamidine cyclo-ligase [Gemmatimonadaceae bacterium]|nr:phosphoribosylformylglycinamidine cyclo-ligase [Gemmatimonadaceae bacterium]
MSDNALDYRGAGVDIDAADDAKSRIKRLVESTFTAGARGRFGGFGGMFRMPPEAKRPVLVASADGVGTKIKVAIESGRNDTIGHDLVNHCTNDILVQGAQPMFFLDYVAFGVLEPMAAEAVVAGVAAGCRENECSLIGGETAEMPGVYTPPDYDLAGFVVGWVEEDAILGAERVREGDVLIGLESSGLHTNGYSLARRIVAERMRLRPTDPFPGESASAADVLLRVHRSYLPALRPVLGTIHAMAHITGGGLPGNVNRALPPTMDAEVDTGSWEIPNLFTQLQSAGGVAREEMFRAFNMGVGMVVIAAPGDVETIVRAAQSEGVRAWRLGRVIRGQGQVVIS